MNALFSQFNYIIPKKDIQGNQLTLVDMNFFKCFDSTQPDYFFLIPHRKKFFLLRYSEQ